MWYHIYWRSESVVRLDTERWLLGSVHHGHCNMIHVRARLAAMAEPLERVGSSFSQAARVHHNLTITKQLTKNLPCDVLDDKHTQD